MKLESPEDIKALLDELYTQLAQKYVGDKQVLTLEDVVAIIRKERKEAMEFATRAVLANSMLTAAASGVSLGVEKTKLVIDTSMDMAVHTTSNLEVIKVFQESMAGTKPVAKESTADDAVDQAKADLVKLMNGGVL